MRPTTTCPCTAGKMSRRPTSTASRAKGWSSTGRTCPWPCATPAEPRSTRACTRPAMARAGTTLPRARAPKACRTTSATSAIGWACAAKSTSGRTTVFHLKTCRASRAGACIPIPSSALRGFAHLSGKIQTRPSVSWSGFLNRTRRGLWAIPIISISTRSNCRPTWPTRPKRAVITPNTSQK